MLNDFLKCMQISDVQSYLRIKQYHDRRQLCVHEQDLTRRFLWGYLQWAEACIRVPPQGGPSSAFLKLGGEKIFLVSSSWARLTNIKYWAKCPTGPFCFSFPGLCKWNWEGVAPSSFCSQWGCSFLYSAKSVTFPLSAFHLPTRCWIPSAATVSFTILSVENYTGFFSFF